MSAPFQFSQETPYLQDVAFDAEVPELIHDSLWSDGITYRTPYVHGTDPSAVPTNTTDSGHTHELRAIEHSMYRGNPPIAHITHTRHASQVYTSPTHINQYMQPNLTIWGSADTWMNPESFLTASSSLAGRVKETDVNDLTSASRPPYDLRLRDTCWNSHVAFDPCKALMLDPSDRLLSQALIGTEIRNTGHSLLDQPGAYGSPSFSSQTTPSHDPSGLNDLNVADVTFRPHHPAPPPSLPSHPQPNPEFLPVLPQNSTLSFRRRRAARAIEYDGLWVDEEELFKGMTEPNGTFTIHPCRWEEDRNVCHLWIKGEKSSMNAHIQKWHGRKAGGEKFRVDCRWSACKKKMRKESITRHIVRTHLGEKWRCQVCGKAVTRNDTYWQHAVKSNLEACNTAGALITYASDVRVIDARAALGSGGRIRYAD